MLNECLNRFMVGKKKKKKIMYDDRNEKKY